MNIHLWSIAAANRLDCSHHTTTQPVRVGSVFVGKGDLVRWMFVVPVRCNDVLG